VSVLELTADGWDGAVLGGDRPVLVDFWAAWCAPCRAVAPLIAELAAEYSDRVTVASLDVDRHPAPAVRYQVLSLPTVILFSGGRPVERIAGAVRRGRLVSALDSHLS
jgi:thioredoxin 1